MTSSSEQPTRFASIGRRQVIGAAAALVIAPAAVGIGYAAPGRQDATPGATPEGTPGLGATPEGTPAGEGTPIAGSDGAAFEVGMYDLYFEPADLTIPANTDVMVTAINAGAAQHNWAVEGTDFATPIVNGGITESVTVNLPAGTYEVLCEVPGHAAAGMVGVLTVQ